MHLLTLGTESLPELRPEQVGGDSALFRLQPLPSPLQAFHVLPEIRLCFRFNFPKTPEISASPRVLPEAGGAGGASHSQSTWLYSLAHAWYMLLSYVMNIPQANIGPKQERCFWKSLKYIVLFFFKDTVSILSG